MLYKLFIDYFLFIVILQFILAATSHKCYMQFKYKGSKPLKHTCAINNLSNKIYNNSNSKREKVNVIKIVRGRKKCAFMALNQIN